jgi:hypothetical protein
MKTLKTLKFAAIIASLCILFIKVDVAQAYVVFSQAVATDSQSFFNDATHTYAQSLGLYSGVISSIDFYASYTTAGRHLTMITCDNSDFMTTNICTNGQNFQSVEHLDNSGAKHLNHFTFSPVVASSNQYVYFYIMSGGGVSTTYLYGSNTNNYNAGNFYIMLSGSPTLADLYFVVSAEPTIAITAPATGATITDLTTHLTGVYQLLNGSLYNSISLSFSHRALGLTTTNYVIPITGNYGTFDIPLSTFDFQSNGTFDLTGAAWLKSPQLSDMLISENMVAPAGYNLILNVGTLSTPFSFTPFNTWYAENAAGGYEYPSDFATATAGFFTPIFESAISYANQSLLWLTASNSYDKGYQIGAIFPIAQAYLDKINVFFGGFPLIQFFQFIIIVLLAIFSIRMIFKFIPFFG